MKPRVLVTGATGYVGGRLLTRLDPERFELRCLARRPEFLRGRFPADVEIVQGDVLDAASLEHALRDVDVAYYLIHSMGSDGNFERQDREAARNFANAARRNGVSKIVYLGGLGDPDEELSPHLASRQEVGAILRESGCRVIELRASIVLGSGSLSFELIRALTERLPIMTTPKWVSVPAQPIAIDDLLHYLLLCLEHEFGRDEILEIGGADVVSYGDLMREYARQRGLKRWLIPVPVLTPGLSSHWLQLVTPVYARVGRKLIDSVRHPTVVRDRRARELFDFEPVGVEAAISAALAKEDAYFTAPRWADTVSVVETPRNWAGARFGNRLADIRRARLRATSEEVFAALERIGGDNGWPYADVLWRIRGWLDLVAGGAGMRRGRSHPTKLRAGDVIDCWRIEDVQPGKRLVLAAEMKLPGRAWLRFDLDRDGDECILTQSAVFDPMGLFGLVYWNALWLVHQFMFAGTLRNIAGAVSR